MQTIAGHTHLLLSGFKNGESKEILNRNEYKYQYKRGRNRGAKARRVEKYTFCEGGCLQLLVLFDSIGTLGAIDFSCAVSGFGQVLKSDPRESLWTRAPSL